MCGIAGWLGSTPRGDDYAVRMLELLRHRGPDGQGVQLWPDAALIHARLSIIDLSSAGTQPMKNETGTVWVVFNGEIYNHRELRRSLVARGHRFTGRSDTEILPHLYEEEGVGFLARLRGMFALAIYDLRARTLLLARDRFGIKPLFYAPGTERLAFASEIRALRELPDVDLRPDRQAVADFAALCYIPAPETFYTGIRALLPGEMIHAQWQGETVSWKVQSYHQWAIAPDPRLTLSTAADHAEMLVTAAVERQLESDVSLGSLLSGGIDSSLVSVAAQASLHGALRTFNVRFAEKAYDETWAAVAVANHIRSLHATLDMPQAQGTWEHVTSLLQHAGQPFADTSLFAVNAVCQTMRRHVTVALSGDGGDEGFGGYNYYSWLVKVARWQILPEALWWGAASVCTPLANVGLVSDRLPRQLRDLAGADDTAVMQNLFCWLRKQEHHDLCRQEAALPTRRLFEPQWQYDLPSRASRVERLSAHATELAVRLTLPNDYLFKVDTASMKESLEVRVPMLDEDLFTFALSLPHQLKVDGTQCKRVLREVASRRLPAAVANKPKWGFAVPMDSWVDTEFKVRLRETLVGRASQLDEFFEPSVYQPMVEAYCGGRPYPGVSQQGLYQRMMMLLSVQLAVAPHSA
ncbi:MAG: asparagine synthase (glutamine-hydrolyzing) [Candidatus Binatia bacterium]